MSLRPGVGRTEKLSASRRSFREASCGRLLRRCGAGAGLLLVVAVVASNGDDVSAATNPATSRDGPQRLWDEFPLRQTPATKPSSRRADYRPPRPTTITSSLAVPDLAMSTTTGQEHDRMLTAGMFMWLLLFAVALAPVRTLEAFSLTLARRRGEIVVYGGASITAITLGVMIPILLR